MHLLRLENTSQNYGALALLEEVGFAVDPGQKIDLFGSYGAD